MKKIRCKFCLLFLLAACFVLLDAFQSIKAQPTPVNPVDPAYSKGRVLPQSNDLPGAPWLYADTELEAWKLKELRRRVVEAELKVGYPGKFYEPRNTASFRWIPTDVNWNQYAKGWSSTPQEIEILAYGDIIVTQAGKTVYQASYTDDPHTVTIIPDQEFIVQLQTNADPAAMRIEKSFCSTESRHWQATADGKTWNIPCAYPAKRGGILPHQAETPTVRVTPASQDGNTFDFGRELFGYVTFTASGQPTLYAGESLPETLDNNPDDQEQSTALVSIGNNRWRTKTPLGFRYIRIPNGYPHDLSCDAYAYPVRYKGDLQSSDPLLVPIWMNSAYTLRLCMHEFHLDGIKRDRLPWAGDLALSLMTNAYTFAEPEIIRRTIAVLGREGIEETDINGIIDYSLWWLISQDHYQLYFADRTHLKREWSRIKKAVEVLEKRADKDGLLPADNTWLFIDWVDVEKECALQVLWWWAQQSVAKLAIRMNDKPMADYWNRNSEQLKQVLLQKGYDAANGYWRGNFTSGSGSNRHANFLAVISGLAPESQYPGIIKTLTDPSVKAVGTPYMAAFEYMALARLGEPELMLSKMKDYWDAMIQHGATSFWEGYDVNEKGNEMYAFYERPWAKSLCHAWSSGPAALIPSELLGIRPLEDGWKVFSIEPTIQSVAELKSVVPTPYGNIKVSLTDGKLTAEIPEGCQAIYKGKSYTGKI